MNKLIYFFMILLFFNNCTKEDSLKLEKCPDSILIINSNSNNGLIVNQLDTMIYPTERGDTSKYFIDLNSDNINDYRVSAYFNASPCIYTSELLIESCNNYSQILNDSLIDSPLALKLGDTLGINRNWISGKSYLLKYFNSCPMGGDQENIYGNWYNTIDRYIGLKLENENLYFGWLKISAENKNSIMLHESAYKNSCY